ncbi:hypothetical protein SKAU_G00007130 [Synaphobranchus kaupii]|uniref:Uncharacterized protein n=1 Tax=Synaphobranchus kaupii TaxID=118154 RepID=A0A9Q1JCK7_SYNKA|nr:hypothetical protein SKAU_G00007130 [Synaphobranchus kaupii]
MENKSTKRLQQKEERTTVTYKGPALERDSPNSEDIFDAKDVSAPSSPEPTHQLRADLMTSLLPRHVHGSPFQPSCVSTLKECQDLVGKLRKTTSLQSQGAVPRCILSRKKTSPKAYVLAKAHGRNITSHREVETVILPAHKHSRTTSVTDRQRTRAMQNSCLKTLALLERHHSNNTAACDTLDPEKN